LSQVLPWFVLVDTLIFRRFGLMKKSGLNNYVLSAARALYVFATVAAVCGALFLLNIGGH
jgi:hypothetical protein